MEQKETGRAVPFIPGQTGSSTSPKASRSKRHLLCSGLELLAWSRVKAHLTPAVQAGSDEHTGPEAQPRFPSLASDTLWGTRVSQPPRSCAGVKTFPVPGRAVARPLGDAKRH